MRRPTIATYKYPLLTVAAYMVLFLVVLPLPKVAAVVVQPGGSSSTPSGTSSSPSTVKKPGDSCDSELPAGGHGVIQDDSHTCCPGGATNTPAKACLFDKYLNPAIALFSAAVGLLVVISIIYGAFETVTAGSDVAKAAAGRKRIIQALIGLFAYASLYALLQFLVPGGIPL